MKYSACQTATTFSSCSWYYENGVTGLNLIFKQILQAILLTAILPAMAFSMVSSGSANHLNLSKKQNDSQLLVIPVLGKDGKIEEMPLEEYVVNVILGEISANFHEEAIKAQAVAARTYTLQCLEAASKHQNRAVCTDFRCCQAYREPEEYLESGGTEREIDKVQKAVQDTALEVLYHDETLICSTYFASSGGRTEDAAEVWGEEYPYLKSVESPGEENCGYYSQETSYSPQELQELLDVTLVGKPPSWFGMVTYTPGGGVDLMRIGGKLYTGVELRSKLGLRSTAFEIIPTDEVILIKTKGYGHRVGMSQHGANAMAQQGRDYAEILSHYYIGTTLRQYSKGND